MPDHPANEPAPAGPLPLRPAAMDLVARSLLAGADPTFLTCGPNALVADLNDEAERVFGRSRAELTGEPLARGFPTQRHAQLADLLRRCAHGETIRAVECARLGADGEPGPVALTLILLSSAPGQPDWIAVVVRDLSELRQAEARLRRMTKVFQDGATPICINDLRGYVLDWNDAAERVLGWTRARSCSGRGGPFSLPSGTPSPTRSSSACSAERPSGTSSSSSGAKRAGRSPWWAPVPSWPTKRASRRPSASSRRTSPR